MVFETAERGYLIGLPENCLLLLLRIRPVLHFRSEGVFNLELYPSEKKPAVACVEDRFDPARRNGHDATNSNPHFLQMYLPAVPVTPLSVV